MSKDTKANTTKPKAGAGKANNKPKRHPVARAPKFHGTCDGLKGNVFDCNPSCSKQTDVYAKTLAALKVYTGVKYGPDVLDALENMEPTTFMEPPAPDADASYAKNHKWKNQYDKWAKCADTYTTNMKELYSLIVGQCSNLMLSNVNKSSEAEALEKKQDALKFLKIIQTVSYNVTTTEEIVVASYRVVKSFYALFQHPNETLLKYLDNFNNLVEVADTIGANLTGHESINDTALKEAGQVTIVGKFRSR